METVKVPIHYVEWCNNCQMDVEVGRFAKRIANRLYIGYACSECQKWIIFKEK